MVSRADLPFYEGAGEGPDVAKLKEAVMRQASVAFDIDGFVEMHKRQRREWERRSASPGAMESRRGSHMLEPSLL